MKKTLSLTFIFLFIVSINLIYPYQIDREVILSDGLSAVLDYYSKSRPGLVSLKLDRNGDKNYKDEPELLDSIGFDLQELPSKPPLEFSKVTFSSESPNGWGFGLSDKVHRYFNYRQICFFPKSSQNLIFIRQTLLPGPQAVVAGKLMSRLALKKFGNFSIESGGDMPSQQEFRKDGISGDWWSMAGSGVRLSWRWLKGTPVKSRSIEYSPDRFLFYGFYENPGKNEFPAGWQISEDFCIYVTRNSSAKSVKEFFNGPEYEKFFITAEKELDRMQEDLKNKENGWRMAFTGVGTSADNETRNQAIDIQILCSKAENIIETARRTSLFYGIPIDPAWLRSNSEKINSCYQNIFSGFYSAMDNENSMGTVYVAGGCPCIWNAKKAQYSSALSNTKQNAATSKKEISDLIALLENQVNGKTIPQDKLPAILLQPSSGSTISNRLVFGDTLDTALSGGHDDAENELGKREKIGFTCIQLNPIPLQDVRTMSGDNNYLYIDSQLTLLSKTNLKVMLSLSEIPQEMSTRESESIKGLVKHVQDKFPGILAGISSRENYSALTESVHSVASDLTVMPYSAFDWPIWKSFDNLLSDPNLHVTETYGTMAHQWYDKFDAAGPTPDAEKAVWLSASEKLWSSFINGRREFLIKAWSSLKSNEESPSFENLMDSKTGLLRRSTANILPVFNEMSSLDNLVQHTEAVADFAVLKGEKNNYTSAAGVLSNSGIPFVIINENKLSEDLQKYRALWIAGPEIDGKNSDLIRSWVENGGSAVISGVNDSGILKKITGIKFDDEIDFPKEIKFAGQTLTVPVVSSDGFSNEGYKLMSKETGPAFDLKLPADAKDVKAIASYSDNQPAIVSVQIGKGKIIISGFPIDSSFDFIAFKTELSPATLNVAEPESRRESIIGMYTKAVDIIIDQLIQRRFKIDKTGYYSTANNVATFLRRNPEDPSVLYAFILNTGHAVKSPLVTDLREGNDLQAQLTFSRPVSQVTELIRRSNVPFTMKGSDAVVSLDLNPGCCMVLEIR